MKHTHDVDQFGSGSMDVIKHFPHGASNFGQRRERDHTGEGVGQETKTCAWRNEVRRFCWLKEGTIFHMFKCGGTFLPYDTTTGAAGASKVVIIVATSKPAAMANTK